MVTRLVPIVLFRAEDPADGLAQPDPEDDPAVQEGVGHIHHGLGYRALDAGLPRHENLQRVLSGDKRGVARDAAHLHADRIAAEHRVIRPGARGVIAQAVPAAPAQEHCAVRHAQGLERDGRGRCIQRADGTDGRRREQEEAVHAVRVAGRGRRRLAGREDDGVGVRREDRHFAEPQPVGRTGEFRERSGQGVERERDRPAVGNPEAHTAGPGPDREAVGRERVAHREPHGPVGARLQPEIHGARLLRVGRRVVDESRVGHGKTLRVGGGQPLPRLRVPAQPCQPLGVADRRHDPEGGVQPRAALLEVRPAVAHGREGARVGAEGELLQVGQPVAVPVEVGVRDGRVAERPPLPGVGDAVAVGVRRGQPRVLIPLGKGGPPRQDRGQQTGRCATDWKHGFHVIALILGEAPTPTQARS